MPGVLFDWDGVLVDSSHLHKESWEILASEQGLELPSGHFERGFGLRNQTIIPEILGWATDPEKIAYLANAKESLYRKLVQERGLTLLPGVLELLRDLKRKEIPYCVASSTPRANIAAILEQNGLWDLFEQIVAAEDVDRGKPEPDVFLLAAKRLKLSPVSCVVVEDAVVGLQAANKAGAATVAIVWGRDERQFALAQKLVSESRNLSAELLLDVVNSHKALSRNLADLSYDEALVRRHLIASDVRMSAHIHFDSTYTRMHSVCTLEWEQAEAGSLSLDFRGHCFRECSLDGQRIVPHWQGAVRLQLPLTDKGLHHFTLEYEVIPGDSGMGLTRVAHGEDLLLYTNFVPMEACRVFPCFDQPDIKARFQLSLKAQPQHKVVANEPCQRVKQETMFWEHEFSETPPLSSYLWHFTVGTLCEVKSEIGKIPMSIYCRSEKLAHLQAEELFTLINRAILWYEDWFLVPFPFSKYDQIFLPGFYWGGMENAGAVVLREEVLFEHIPDADERMDRDNLLLHELSHMWFGNLVTMRWWNDLWLNEAFATWISYECQSSLNRGGDEECLFLEAVVQKALREDDLSTTHPVVMDCPCANEVFDHFDAITYQKGASLINQLDSQLGRSSFQRGLNRYLTRHSYQNSTLAEFLASFECESLMPFSKQWLLTCGYPVIMVGERDITVTSPEPRDFNLEVSLIKDIVSDGFVLETQTYKGNRPTGLVIPNLKHGLYARVALDEATINYVAKHMGALSDRGLRTELSLHLWNSMWLGKCSVGMLPELLNKDARKDFATRILLRRMADVYKFRPDLLDVDSVSDCILSLANSDPGLRKLIWTMALSLSAKSQKVKDWLFEQPNLRKMNILEQRDLELYKIASFPAREKTHEETLHGLRQELIEARNADWNQTLTDFVVHRRLNGRVLGSSEFGRIGSVLTGGCSLELARAFVSLLPQVLNHPGLDMVARRHIVDTIFPLGHVVSLYKALQAVVERLERPADKRSIGKWISQAELWRNIF